MKAYSYFLLFSFVVLSFSSVSAVQSDSEEEGQKTSSELVLVGRGKFPDFHNSLNGRMKRETYDTQLLARAVQEETQKHGTVPELDSFRYQIFEQLKTTYNITDLAGVLALVQQRKTVVKIQEEFVRIKRQGNEELKKAVERQLTETDPNKVIPGMPDDLRNSINSAIANAPVSAEQERKLAKKFARRGLTVGGLYGGFLGGSLVGLIWYIKSR